MRLEELLAFGIPSLQGLSTIPRPSQMGEVVIRSVVGKASVKTVLYFCGVNSLNLIGGDYINSRDGEILRGNNLIRIPLESIEKYKVIEKLD